MNYTTDNKKECQTWEVFLEYLEEIKLWRIEKEESNGFATELIFRGVSDSTYELKTSLERKRGENKYLIDDYYEKVLKFSQQNNGTLNQNLPTLDLYITLVQNASSFTALREAIVPAQYPAVEENFLYLRHYGYPSPLLDWTMCPSIAAFFAFNNNSSSEKVSIYIFLESIGEVIDVPDAIHTIGPIASNNVNPPDRHFKQESHYTFCVERESPSPGCQGAKSMKKFFSSHETIFHRNPDNQQYRWKCDIPSTEREKVLQLLDSQGINYPYLFNPGQFPEASDEDRKTFLRG